MREKCIDVLIRLGVPANILGFAYICDIIEMYASDEKNLTAKLMGIYATIAEKHNTGWSRVERAIRHAFDSA